jgi:glycosyltransferase involved in cell wall biosynthesis
LSKVGYEYVISKGERLRKDNIKVILTAYNYIMLESGRVAGYSVNELPRASDFADVVTTDTEIIKQMWIEKYGIENEKIVVTRQPFQVPERARRKLKKDGVVRLLWAAHIRKEKNPEAVVGIAKELGEGYEIDCYGELDRNHYRKNPFIQKHLINLHYKGKFVNFFRDIDLGQYDGFLYTSKFDGTPNVVIEAGFAKLPIISSAVGGVPELIRDDGVLIDNPMDVIAYADAIRRLSKRNVQMAETLYERLVRENSFGFFERQVKEILHKLGK